MNKNKHTKHILNANKTQNTSEKNKESYNEYETQHGMEIKQAI